MASDCIFFSEGRDMGATIPFCTFEVSSRWTLCKYYDHRDPTQELCPRYISKKDVLESLRRQTEGRMTRRAKWLKKVPDRYIEATICDTSRHIKDDCPGCPIKEMCKDMYFEANEYEKYMAAVSKWLDEEAE